MPCDLLDTKFRSASYRADRIHQKQAEVTSEGRQQQVSRSSNIWKRINPTYIDEGATTTNRVLQQYEDGDFKQVKDNFRMRDRHTEYVEYLVRDQALARVKKA